MYRLHILRNLIPAARKSRIVMSAHVFQHPACLARMRAGRYAPLFGIMKECFNEKERDIGDCKQLLYLQWT